LGDSFKKAGVVNAVKHKTERKGADGRGSSGSTIPTRRRGGDEKDDFTPGRCKERNKCVSHRGAQT